MSNQKLLISEQKAKDFVAKIGKKRAEKILSSICKRIDRRYKKACQNSFSDINPEFIYRTKIEVEITYLIKMGLSLNDTDNTPDAARSRILERIKKRKSNRPGNR